MSEKQKYDHSHHTKITRCCTIYIFVAHELAACRSKQSSALCIYGMLHHYHNRLYVMLALCNCSERNLLFDLCPTFHSITLTVPFIGSDQCMGSKTMEFTMEFRLNSCLLFYYKQNLGIDSSVAWALIV